MITIERNTCGLCDSPAHFSGKLTFTLATTVGQLASLFCWRRGLSITLILKGREIFLAGLARQDTSPSTTAFIIECWIHLSAGLLFDQECRLR